MKSIKIHKILNILYKKKFNKIKFREFIKYYKSSKIYYENWRRIMTKYKSIIDNLKEEYSLTLKETKIIGLLIKGKSSIDMQMELNIKAPTLKTHFRNIYKKTNTQNQKDFILFFMNKIGTI